MDSMKGVHHFYLGILMMLAGFILTWYHWVWSLIIFFLGGIICLDDYIQHSIQRTVPDYKSPLHQIFAFALWRFKIVRMITAFFDKLFGKRY